MFSLTNLFESAAKGCKITLQNGYTVSIQWGPGNYCDNYNDNNYRSQAPDSKTAETAIIGPDGKFVHWDGDDVQGHQSPDDVIATLIYAAGL